MPKDLLIGIAEVSIALTGFAGVVVVLGRRSSGPWPLADQFQLRSLIENGLFVVVAALLPFAIFELTADTRLTWRIASGIGICASAHSSSSGSYGSPESAASQGTAGDGQQRVLIAVW
jgi:hypothetical protein